MAIHKYDLVKRIAQAQGLSERQTYGVIQAFLVQVADTLIEEQRLELRGFGVFHISTKPGRQVHHPITGEAYQLAPVQAVEFRAGKQLKARLNPKPVPKKSKKAKPKQQAKKS